MKSLIKKFIVRVLTLESVLILKKYKPKIIAITGTVGKTSTKNAIYGALSQFDFARKSPKSFNSDFGVPLAILGQNVPSVLTDWGAWFSIMVEGMILIIAPNHYPRWLVLEVGTDRPGDIAEITKWLKPDIAIVTKLSKTPVHVENFDGPEEVFKEKGNLVKALKPGGTLVLNASDEDVMRYADWTKEKVVTFGLPRRQAGGGQGNKQNYEIVYEDKKPVGIKFEVEGQAITLSGTLGRQHIQHVSAAMAVISLLGEDLALAAKSFSKEEPAPGRMRIIEGLNGSTIIDDTYNSSPVALHEALNTLKELKVKRKIAVIGDMLELGRFSVDEHRKAGEMAKKICDLVMTVGIRAKVIEGDHHFADSREAGQFLKTIVKEGDAVLVKGSQGVRMERAVEEIMAHPENKRKLLVRQDKMWQ